MGYIKFRQNPNVDFLFSIFGGKPTPTKQDSYRLAGQAVEIEEETGEEKIINNFYVKHPETQATQEYKQHIHEVARNVVGTNIIMKPNNVEVLISISLTKKRFESVDVDNMAKTILDGLVGAAFEDDVQVTTLWVNKHLHPMNINGAFIAITKLTKERQGAIGKIGLFTEEP